MTVTPLKWTARLLAAVALGLSAYLWWTSATTETAVGCNAFAGFDCDAALASPWAKWLGTPVAAGGVLCYGAALVGALLAGGRGAASTAGWRLLEATTPLAVGAGIWFTMIQATRLDSFCLYCLATHACGLAMAAAVLLWRRMAMDTDGGAPVGLSPIGIDSNNTAASRRLTEGPPSPGLPTVAGVLGVIALAAGQTLMAEPTVVEYVPELTDQVVFEPPPEADPAAMAAEPDQDGSDEEAAPANPESKARPARRRDGSREASFLRGQVKIDAYDHAVLGSPDAPHLVVELMDYACPHCREFHDKLTEALRRFDGQIAVVVMPVPGEITCNPYVRKARKNSAGACYAAKLSMAVAKLEPEEFERFHEWMLRDDKIPSRTSSLSEAWRHADKDELSGELRDSEGRIAGRLKSYIGLAEMLGRQGRFGLPAQILGDKVVAGPAESVDALCESWAEAFGLEAPTQEIPF